MKATLEIDLTKTYLLDSSCVSLPRELLRLRDINIPKVLSLLEGLGIIIDPNNSEVSVIYTSRREERETKAPLLTQFPKGTKISRYHLYGEPWSIDLEDHLREIGSGEMMDGGRYDIRGGILVRITNENYDGSWEKIDRVGKTIVDYIRSIRAQK